MSSLRYYVARSDAPLARVLRRSVRWVIDTPLPTPRVVFVPIAKGWGLAQVFYYFFKRKLLTEPFFKAQCASYGHNVRCGNFLHWISGTGDIVLGDSVHIDGKVDIMFAVLRPERPRLEIGDHTYVNHRCLFSVAHRITLGRHVFVAANVRFLDSPGHPLDPEARLAHAPPSPEQIQPVTVGDNVWIGMDVIVLPGVTIGEGSVIAAGSIVARDVPPYTLAAGAPAKPVRELRSA